MHLDSLSLLAHCTHCYERENHENGIQSMRKQEIPNTGIKTVPVTEACTPSPPSHSRMGFC